MRGLTEKQREILDFIEDFSELEGMAPTVYEIAEEFNVKSSTISAHLQALQKKGFLSRTNKARSLNLKRRAPRKVRHMSFALPIPLLGRVNAGALVDNLEYKEGDVFCSPELFRHADIKRFFALKVYGESMRDLGIYEGDVVIVKQTKQVKKGDIVVALVNGESTIKSYYPMGDIIELRPANPDFEIQKYPAKDVGIQGVVVSLQRMY